MKSRIQKHKKAKEIKEIKGNQEEREVSKKAKNLLYLKEFKWKAEIQKIQETKKV